MSLVMKANLGTVTYLVPATDKRPEITGYLGTFDKHLLLVLADRGNADGHSIYPSVEWMAKAMGATERAVSYSLLRLKGTFPRILVVEKDQVSRYSTLHYRISVTALERVEQWKLRVEERAGVNDVHPSGVLRGERSSVRGELSSSRGELSSPEPSVEPSVEPSEPTTESKALAPKGGAAKSARATRGVLLETAVAVDAEVFEAPPVPRPRPAGGTHVAAPAPGAPDHAAPVATAPISPAAARGPVPRDLLIAFDRAYTARFGVRHPKMGGQEAALAKGLLEQYGLPKCLEFVEAFFTVQDAWLERTGKGFKIFAMANTITKLIALPTAVPVGRPASISEKWAGAKPGLVSL